MKILALPLCGLELGLEYKLHEAYQLLLPYWKNPFPSFCYACLCTQMCTFIDAYKRFHLSILAISFGQDLTRIRSDFSTCKRKKKIKTKTTIKDSQDMYLYHQLFYLSCSGFLVYIVKFAFS